MSGLKTIFSAFFRFLSFAFLAFLGFILIVFGVKDRFRSPITPDDLHSVSVVGTLSASPDINTYGRNQHVNISLREFQGRVFSITDNSLEATDWASLNDNVMPGDSLFMDVSDPESGNNTDETEEQVYRQSPTIYSLGSKNMVFLSAQNYCKKTNESWGAGVFSLVSGVLIMAALIAELFGKKRRRRKVIPEN